MSWDGFFDAIGRGVAYGKGFRDALEGRGRTLRYLPGGSNLKSDEDRELYAQGYQDGLTERLLRQQKSG